MRNKLINISLVAIMMLAIKIASAEENMSEAANKCKDEDDIIKCMQDHNKENAPPQDKGGSTTIMPSSHGGVPIDSGIQSN